MRKTTPARKARRSVIAACAALASVAFSVTGANPAGASTCTATLEIRRYIPDAVNFVVRGVIPMSEADAMGYLLNGAYIFLEMWGDDSIYDDYILGSPVVYRNALDPNMRWTPNGIEFDWFPTVSRSSLDEDWGEDEIFVNAVVIDGDRGILCDAETSRISRYF